MSEEAKTSVDELLAQGKSLFARGEFQEAVNKFEQVCSELGKDCDQMSTKLAEPYFLYGNALLEVARTEAPVLGAGVGGIEAENSSEEDIAEGNTDEPAEESVKESVKEETSSTEAQGSSTIKEDKTPPEGSDKPSSSSGQVEQEREGEGDQKCEEQETDVPTLQLAWEVLELSRIIYEKEEIEKNVERLSEIHILLGEINMESDHQENALEEFRKALKIREANMSPEDRRIAECHFNLGMANTFAKNYDHAVESYELAKGVLSKKLDLLMSQEGKSSKVEDEIKELTELIPDVDLKIQDVLEMKKLENARPRDEQMESANRGFDSPKLNPDTKPQQIAIRRGSKSDFNRKRDNTGKEEEQSNGSDAKRLKTESNGEEDSTSKESATAEQ